MGKRYAWPECTVPECGHNATHKTEAAAQKAAKGMQRRYTTPNGDAVCKCHDESTDSRFIANGEEPRHQFRCDQYRATAPEHAEPEPEPGDSDGIVAAMIPAEPEAISVPPPVTQPFDPRDIAPW